MGAQTTSEPADLTPSEVALARVLAAWEAWWTMPGDCSEAGEVMAGMGRMLFTRGEFLDRSGLPTSKGLALLARARKAGVL